MISSEQSTELTMAKTCICDSFDWFVLFDILSTGKEYDGQTQIPSCSVHKITLKSHLCQRHTVHRHILSHPSHLCTPTPRHKLGKVIIPFY